MQLPRHVDPRKLAAQGALLQGTAATAAMDRLLSAVIAAEPALVELQFSRDEAYRSIVEGKFSLAVTLQCQRCLHPVTEQLSGRFRLGIVWDEDRAAVLPRELDPWLVSGESADLYGLVEDEILLALPIVAYHPEAECLGEGHFSTGEFEETRESPFSVLAQLKK